MTSLKRKPGDDVSNSPPPTPNPTRGSHPRWRPLDGNQAGAIATGSPNAPTALKRTPWLQLAIESLHEHSDGLGVEDIFDGIKKDLRVAGLEEADALVKMKQALEAQEKRGAWAKVKRIIDPHSGAARWVLNNPDEVEGGARSSITGNNRKPESDDHDNIVVRGIESGTTGDDYVQSIGWENVEAVPGTSTDQSRAQSASMATRSPEMRPQSCAPVEPTSLNGPVAMQHAHGGNAGERPDGHYSAGPEVSIASAHQNGDMYSSAEADLSWVKIVRELKATKADSEALKIELSNMTALLPNIELLQEQVEKSAKTAAEASQAADRDREELFRAKQMENDIAEKTDQLAHKQRHYDEQRSGLEKELDLLNPLFKMV